MNKTLKNVEALPEGISEAALLGFDGEDVAALQEEETEILLPSRPDIAVPAND